MYKRQARKEPFTSDDLLKIETRMSEIIDQDVKTKREVWERKKAINHFKKIGEKYKAEIIESIPDSGSFQYIITAKLGMTYVEVLIYLLQVKLEKLLNLQKFQEHIGVVTQITKCFKEYMARVGVQKKN